MQNQNEKKTNDLLQYLKTNYHLTPNKIAVIIALLSGSLDVQSITIDKSQTVTIELTGSLHKKTPADKIVDEMYQMPFGEVWDALKRK